MEGKRVVIETKDLDLLEQKIRKATELIRGLRKDRDLARTKLQETQQQLDGLQAEVRMIEKERQGASEMSEQIKMLTEERQEVRGRVTRMLEMMSGLEESASMAQTDH